MRLPGPIPLLRGLRTLSERQNLLCRIERILDSHLSRALVERVDDAISIRLGCVVHGFLDAPVVVRKLYLAEGDGICGHLGELVGGGGGGEEEGGEGELISIGQLIQKVNAFHSRLHLLDSCIS